MVDAILYDLLGVVCFVLCMRDWSVDVSQTTRLESKVDDGASRPCLPCGIGYRRACPI